VEACATPLELATVLIRLYPDCPDEPGIAEAAAVCAGAALQAEVLAQVEREAVSEGYTIPLPTVPLSCTVKAEPDHF